MRPLTLTQKANVCQMHFKIFFLLDVNFNKPTSRFLYLSYLQKF